ncbi:MAG: cupredoxin domain-containing protein [Chloroflexi bacterium]|nr:cupredoxin domain-containing protein [Chloroflexota bacterium]
MNTSKQINAMIVLMALLLVGMGFYTIWDPFRQETEADRTNEKIVGRAANIFVQNCAVCHGSSGQGRIGPALNPASRTGAQVNLTDEATRAEKQLLVRDTLTCGRVGTRMPPWSVAQGGSLNDEQIRQLIILITENPGGNAWEQVTALAEERARENPPLTLVPVADVPVNITGSTNYVCGQKPVGTPEPTPPPTPGPVTANPTLVMTDNKFDKNSLTVPAGAPVTLALSNNGGALHNWRVLNQNGANGQPIKSPDLLGGQNATYTFTISQPGSYEFQCDYHATEMKGTLFVQ